MTELKQRHEIIFLYDVTDANPNGDPDDANRPRMDHRGYNIVTDVRLKRTIRDYWIDKYGSDGKKVLIRRVEKVEDGTVKSMGNLITDALDLPEKISKGDSAKVVKRIRKEIPNKFIDVRFFGAAVTLKNANVSITGPAQFGIGRSLNRPRLESHTITTTFASGDDKKTGTFGQTHTVDYSLIGFGGIISETTAETTGLEEEDLQLLWDGLWDGTKNLNTRSKFNHLPRLLVSVVSKDGEFQIGGLYRKMDIITENKDERINSEDDVIIDLTEFLKALTEYQSSIDRILVKEDYSLQYSLDDKKIESLKITLENAKFTVQVIE